MLKCPSHSYSSLQPQVHAFVLPSLPVLCPASSEPPVTMVRVPRDLGVPETGVASFECELSRPNAEVKWFKVKVHPNPLQQHLAMSSSLLCPLAAAFPARAEDRAEGPKQWDAACLSPCRMDRSCGQGPTAASTQRDGAASCS